MKPDFEILKKSAQRAYEYGRIRHALKYLFVLLPLLLMSLYLCAKPNISICIGVFLALLLVGLIWKGQEWSRGAKLGLFSGTVAFSVPVIMHLSGFCCVLDIEYFICIASGLVAGLLTASRVHTVAPDRKEYFLLSASLVAGLTASLGCAYLGIAGALGVLAGVFIVATPVLFLSRAAAR